MLWHCIKYLHPYKHIKKKPIRNKQTISSLSFFSFFSIKHIFVLIVSDLQYFENSITNLPTDDEKASNKGKADMKKSNKIMVILFSTCTQQLQSQQESNIEADQMLHSMSCELMKNYIKK